MQDNASKQIFLRTAYIFFYLAMLAIIFLLAVIISLSTKQPSTHTVKAFTAVETDLNSLRSSNRQREHITFRYSQHKVLEYGSDYKYLKAFQYNDYDFPQITYQLFKFENNTAVGMYDQNYCQHFIDFTIHGDYLYVGCVNILSKAIERGSGNEVALKVFVYDLRTDELVANYEVDTSYDTPEIQDSYYDNELDFNIEVFDGDIWIGIEDNLYQIDAKTGEVKGYFGLLVEEAEKYSGAVNFHYMYLYVDRVHNRLWAYQEGAFALYEGNGNWRLFSTQIPDITYTDNESLLGNSHRFSKTEPTQLEIFDQEFYFFGEDRYTGSKYHYVQFNYSTLEWEKVDEKVFEIGADDDPWTTPETDTFESSIEQIHVIIDERPNLLETEEFECGVIFYVDFSIAGVTNFTSREEIELPAGAVPDETFNKYDIPILVEQDCDLNKSELLSRSLTEFMNGEWSPTNRAEYGFKPIPNLEGLEKVVISEGNDKTIINLVGETILIREYNGWDVKHEIESIIEIYYPKGSYEVQVNGSNPKYNSLGIYVTG